MSKTVKDVIFLLIGSFVFSLAVNMFVIPIGLGEGGVTGISIILYYTTHLSTGITNFILNGILLIVGYKFLEKKTIVYTMITIIATSISLHVTEGWGLHLHEELIKLKKLIKKIDDEAFVIVHDVRDVIGKSFLSA
ncbi:YitT family protein [Priestia megaterium]|uniref:YitT family protein n=1 Tax=Priestia megaterium TaxID=1404 RepID=UPI002E1F48EE|nr:YitT family protein [Priestia megaterium]